MALAPTTTATSQYLSRMHRWEFGGPRQMTAWCSNYAGKNFLSTSRPVSRLCYPRDRSAPLLLSLISLDYPNSYLTVLALQGYLSLC